MSEDLDAVETREWIGGTTAQAPAPRPPTTQRGDLHAEVLVLGAGPGGYGAAFMAAEAFEGTITDLYLPKKK